MLNYLSFCNYYNFNGCVGNTDAQNVFNYLSQPENIYNMIVFSNVNLPAISGIVHSLENIFATTTDFPLTNPTNRQTVGRMVKFIMEHFGYEPIASGLDKDSKLRDFSNAQYFKRPSVYSKTKAPINTISMTII